MPGPARAGGLIYAKNMERLSAFYETLLSMSKIHVSADHIVLESPDFQLIVHAMPSDIARTVVVESPPERREQTPIKLFFTIPSISAARSQAAKLGGEIYSDRWQGPGFGVCNACDPEGNIFQVRESAP
jgi:predicted enzyme related to lactoylglutathione lyase